MLHTNLSVASDIPVELQPRQALRLAINDSNSKIVLDARSIIQSLDSFSDSSFLDTQNSRFYLLPIQQNHDSEDDERKFILLAFCPTTASKKERMIYASSMLVLKTYWKSHLTITREISAESRDEVKESLSGVGTEIDKRKFMSAPELARLHMLEQQELERQELCDHMEDKMTEAAKSGGLIRQQFPLTPCAESAIRAMLCGDDQEVHAFHRIMPLQVVDDQVQSSVIKAVRPDAVDEPLPGVELEEPGFFLFCSNAGQRAFIYYCPMEHTKPKERLLKAAMKPQLYTDLNELLTHGSSTGTTKKLDKVEVYSAKEMTAQFIMDALMNNPPSPGDIQPRTTSLPQLSSSSAPTSPIKGTNNNIAGVLPRLQNTFKRVAGPHKKLLHQQQQSRPHSIASIHELSSPSSSKPSTPSSATERPWSYGAPQPACLSDAQVVDSGVQLDDDDNQADEEKDQLSQEVVQVDRKSGAVKNVADRPKSEHVHGQTALEMLASVFRDRRHSSFNG